MPNAPPPCARRRGRRQGLLRSCFAAALLASRAVGLRNAPGPHPCVEALVDAARACRAERRPFSITDFLAIPDEELGVLPSTERIDEEAAAAVNASYPGLRALDARQQVYLVEDFLSASEADGLIRAPDLAEFAPSAMRAEGYLKLVAKAEHELGLRSRPGANRTCADMVHEAVPCGGVGFRNSSTLKLDDGLGAVQLVRGRIAQLLPGLVRQHCLEPLGLTRYTAGGFYSRHSDGRRATVIVYLRGDDAVGGATVFPHLGLRVPPRQGRALLFFPTFADGDRKAEMVHLAEELQDGEKVVVQQWIDIPGQRDCEEDTAGW